MARPYSLDLRNRVVAAVDAGSTCRAVAERFGVSVASVVKWSQRFRRLGSAAPGKMGGHKRFVLAGDRDWLLARIAEKPDLTLETLRLELAARGRKVSLFTVWYFLKREGLSFKKNAARSGAIAGGRGPQARAVEAASAQA